MNMAANKNDFMPKAPQAGLQSRVKAPMAFAAAFMLYALYASVAQIWPQNGQEVLPAETGIEQLPAVLSALAPEERQARIARAGRALANDPLDRDALTALSLLYSADGQAKRAEDLTIAAAARGLRDARSQAMALRLKLERGDADGAVNSLDALIRAQPDTQSELFGTLLALSATEKGAGPVTAKLASDPPWRVNFIQWAAEKSGQPQQAYRIISAMKSADAAPHVAETQSLLRHYVSAKDYGTAYFIWLDLLSEAQLRKAGNIYDSGFDLPMDSLYFGWTLNHPKSVETTVVPRANGSSDNVLRVDFVNNRDIVAPLNQLLRLAPGQYVFSGDFKAEDLKTDSGLSWRINCLEGTSNIIHFSSPLSGTRQWDHFEARLDVPADCTTQQLYLVMRSDAALDQHVSGRAYYDNLSIAAATPGP